MRPTSILRVAIPMTVFLASVSTGYSAVIVAGAHSATTPFTVSPDQLNKYTNPNVTLSLPGSAVSGDANLLTDGSNETAHVVVYGATRTIQFDFATPQDITSIETFTRYTEDAHIDQDYIVTYATSVQPIYATLTSVAYHPSLAGNTKVSITDDASANLITGATSVRFIMFDDIAPQPQNGYVPYTELSINGVVPEPTSLAALSLGGLGLLARRRVTRSA